MQHAALCPEWPRGDPPPPVLVLEAFGGWRALRGLENQPPRVRGGGDSLRVRLCRPRVLLPWTAVAQAGLRKFHEVDVQSALDLRNIVFGSFDRTHKELD